MAETRYEIREVLLVLPKEKETSEFHKELNIISWYGNDPKYDIRGWNDDRSKMTKGISLSAEEFKAMATKGLDKIGGNEDGSN